MICESSILTCRLQKVQENEEIMIVIGEIWIYFFLIRNL